MCWLFAFVHVTVAKVPWEGMRCTNPGLVRYWDEITSFQIDDGELVQVEGCDFSGVCGTIPRSFYRLSDDRKLLLSTKAAAVSLGVSWVNFKVQTGYNEVREKRYALWPFELPVERLQKSLRYLQLADGALVQIPDSFNQKVRLCFSVDSEFGAKLSFAPVDIGDLEKFIWDGSYQCLYVQPKMRGRITGRQVAWAGLPNQVQIQFSGSKNLPVTGDGGELEPWESYFLLKCGDSRCNYLTDANIIEASGVIDAENRRFNSDKLPEDGFYAVLGRNSTVFGVTVVSKGKPAAFQQKFEWKYMAGLLAAVAACWAVWALFDCLMKKSR